jgi:hypothetical protein
VVALRLDRATGRRDATLKALVQRLLSGSAVERRAVECATLALARAAPGVV